MQIEFDDNKVKKIFSDYSLMKKSVKIEIVKMIKKRIDALIASESFYIFLKTGLGKPHALIGDLNGCYGITVSVNYRLIVKPIAADLSVESLKKCDSLIVKGVEDYHGGKNNWIIP